MVSPEIAAYICVFHVVSAFPVTFPPFQCFADVCNANEQQEFCDTADVIRRCRQCSDVRQDCFTSKQEANCSEYCYEYRHHQDLEIQRVKGCTLPSPPKKMVVSVGTKHTYRTM
ncbi:hypothetical protein DPMN_061951 [Dreissena polymorpha]|uniref:Secreted protein n=1 Tax=Dreissena polymorpha TaxID=45954 RepID=A0A9D4HHC7_DREPO|nr:hypothetical protein DPMN_061951 [Dreissena polymorpha]